MSFRSFCIVIFFWIGTSETANWILANTKKCPMCNSRIEKNQGCNHMNCKICKHEFCWICMGIDWLHIGLTRSNGFVNTLYAISQSNVLLLVFCFSSFDRPLVWARARNRRVLQVQPVRREQERQQLHCRAGDEEALMSILGNSPFICLSFPSAVVWLLQLIYISHGILLQ